MYVYAHIFAPLSLSFVCLLWIHATPATQKWLFWSWSCTLYCVYTVYIPPQSTTTQQLWVSIGSGLTLWLCCATYINLQHYTAFTVYYSWWLPLSGQTVTPCTDITVCGRLGTNHSAASFLYTARSQRSVSALKAPVGPRRCWICWKKSEDALTCRFRAPAFRCKTIEGNLQAASPRDTTMKSLKGPALNPSMFRPRLDDLQPALSSLCSGAFPGNAVKQACKILKSSFLERHAKNTAKREHHWGKWGL